MSLIVPTRHAESSFPPSPSCSRWQSDGSSPQTGARSPAHSRRTDVPGCRTRSPHTPSCRSVLYGAAVQCPHSPSASPTHLRVPCRYAPCSSHHLAASAGCQGVCAAGCCPPSRLPSPSPGAPFGSLRCCRLRLLRPSTSPSSPSSLSDSSPLTGQEPA